MTRTIRLDGDWNFRQLNANGDGAAWTKVELPHNPFVADLDGREHWFGICEYRRSISLADMEPGGRCTLHVGAAMHSAIVAVDGREHARHSGGFLPFEIDLTEALRDGDLHELTISIDNRDNPDVPPGKPYADLDFCWYGGLYRDVSLRCYPPVHITDEVGAARVASGGIFIRTLHASRESATVSVATHLRNSGDAAASVIGEVEISNGPTVVARGKSAMLTLAAGAETQFTIELKIAQPALWQIDSPALHEARISLVQSDGTAVDVRQQRFGIRRIAFSRSGGFTLNGRRLRLRGTNRHQEYPRVGYAVPAAAQRRDARLIKEAGFDYVRLSHYPQSPDFLDACDELGIVVTNAIPGWQFMGGDKFKAACETNARELIRRDRNHPCVVLWELSLNETAMDEEFMARLHRAGHEEYPGDQFFSCGWQDRYDVYIHSRQHGEIHRWQNGDKALVIAEYGDWEFFASNQGFDQKTGAGIYDWGHGRQRRHHGERGLRQQMTNHMVALNDTLSSPAVLDGLWSMFDYARGYDPNRAACGIRDIFRLPKFSCYFFRSQRDATEQGMQWNNGPVVFIASHWIPSSDLRVFVFSNCDEVELRLNGKILARKSPTKAWLTQYLPHPPFVFDLPVFTAGELSAIGYTAGETVATHRVATPQAPAEIKIEIANEGIVAPTGEPDVLIAHARILDRGNTLCVADERKVEFTIQGDAEIVGPTSVTTEAGVASVVIRVNRSSRSFFLKAVASGSEYSMEDCASWNRH